MNVPSLIPSAATLVALLAVLSVSQFFHPSELQFSQAVGLPTPEALNAPTTASEPLQEYTFERIEMAMPVQITVWAESEDVAKTACKKAFHRVRELVAVFSDYDPSSEINRLLKGTVGNPAKVSDELIDVLSFSERLSRKSQGAFDPTFGPVIHLWRQARKSQTLPDESAIKFTKQQSGFERLQINRSRREVTVLGDSMKLDFGGVAKGYIGDEVIRLLKIEGITRAKFRAGGDIVLGDAPPNLPGWRIEFESGQRRTSFQLSNCGVSTSGDRYQFVEIEGTRYSHVVDPRTGVGITTGRKAFVVAASGMQSDALATAGCAMNDSEFQDLLKRENAEGWAESASFR